MRHLDADDAVLFRTHVADGIDMCTEGFQIQNALAGRDAWTVFGHYRF